MHGRKVLATLLLLSVWLVQVRYPPLSYPAGGLCVLTIITAMAVLLPVRRFVAARQAGVPLMGHPALLPGIALLGWYLLRWAAAGLPATGASTVGTLLWAAVYLVIAFMLTPSPSEPAETSHRGDLSLPALLIIVLSLTGLACGFHAIWQYHISYLESWQYLLNSIGSRPPDRTEAALLHHLQLRRVASVWGDPNTLATFSAISVCASLEALLSRPKFNIVIRAMAALSVGVCLTAIYYTGSRGGALDAFVVIFGFGVFLLWRRRFGSKRRGLVTGLLLAIATLSVPMHTLGEGEQITDLAQARDKPSSWAWRSDTIRERLYYLQVGEKMIRMAPLVGLGPGSVELYFGRLKPAEARESKYLHNWVVQTWADTGLIGLLLTVWFLSAIAWRIWHFQLWRQSYVRAFVVIFFLMIADGLLQVSWNQRELMATFGIVSGIIMARTESPVLSAGRSKISSCWSLAGFLAVAVMFAVVETRYLAAASNKQIARDAMYAGDFELAKTHWNRAAMWMPGDAEPIAAQASIARGDAQLSSARMFIEKALKLEPDSASLHSQAAEILKALGKVDDGTSHLRSALKLYPTNPEYNYMYARDLQSQGQLQAALQYAQRAAGYNYELDTRDRYDQFIVELKDSLAKESSQ